MNKNDMIEVVITSPPEHQELLAEIESLEFTEGHRIESAGTDGGGDLVTLLCSMGSAGITAFIAFLKAKLAQAKVLKIKVGGVEVEGSDPERVEEIARRLLKDQEKAEKGKKKK